MDISLISISHKNAPLEVRARFAFPVEAQEELMRQVIARNIAEECVFISTCNRTEIYTYHACPGSNFIKMQALLFEFAGIQGEEEMGDYVRMYQGSKAIKHLFHVAAGLDSMVMGEDQILGQVKRAHEQAHQIGTCGVYLNTLFRYAVTAAKKVKTEQGLGTLHGKKVMLIGASGKIGGVVLKNLQCIEGAKVCITSRNMSQVKEDHHHRITYQVMEYDNRYELMDEMDVIISATASPHYTVTYGKLSKVLKTEKPRVLIDLAVPIDIEAKVEQIPGVKRFDVDDFQELARVNNEKKQHEVQAADQILAEIQKDFERWMVFQLSLPKIEQLKKRMLEEAEKKGFERAIDKMLYKLRDHSEPSELYAFFSHMEEND